MELGYWLNAAATGSGIVTEGARALLTAAAVLPGIDVVEIHCHVANAPSNGVPRRLGFHRARLDGDTRIWQRTLAEPGDANR